MGSINQIVQYEFNGKVYRSFMEAEAAAVDAFGEAVDSILMDLEKKHGDALRFRSWNVSLVEQMWARREEFAALLGVPYNPSSYIQECIENADTDD